MTGAERYGLFDEDNNQIAFIAVRHMPHPKNKKIKMVHRFVVLPDYQGIGIGGALLEFVAELYNQQGYDFRIVSSAKNIIRKLAKSSKWITKRYGIVRGGSRTAKSEIVKTHRKVITGSFLYKHTN